MRDDRPWSPVRRSRAAGRHVTPPAHFGKPVDPVAATGRTLGWGIVATGAIARSVAPQIAALEDARIVAVSSRDARKATEFAATLGEDVHGYGNDDAALGYEHLADDPRVDVVYVATPNGAHLDVTTAMLRAGKHVVVEKTMAQTAAEARTMVAEARAAGRFLMEGAWTRFLPLHARVMEIVATGEIGTPVWFQGDLGFVAPEDPRSRLWAVEDGGGALLDLMVYPWSWAYGIFGPPIDVQARASLAPNGVDAWSHVTFGYSTGAVASMMGTFVSEATRTAVVVGTKGTIRIEAALPNPRAIAVSTAAGERIEPAPAHAAPFTHQFREVTRCIQDGLLECPTMPLRDTTSMMEAFDAIRLASGDGTRRRLQSVP